MSILQVSWRASKGDCCPICGGDHSCSLTAQDIYFCWRKHESAPNFEYIRDTKNGFGLFVKVNSQDGNASSHLKSAESKATATHTPATNKNKPRPRRPAPETDWNAHLAANRANEDEIRELADKILGVHPDSLRRLEIGYVPETENDHRHWLFPERGADGEIIGILRRYLSGDKKRMAGARSGILFDPQEDYAAHQAVLIVEGPSDTAAAWTLGLAAMGRPNNSGGSDLLAPLIRRTVGEGVMAVVLGERDRKPSGHWPGKEGAVKVATELAGMLGRPVWWSLPPAGMKDLRKWLIETGVDPCDRPACQEMGREILKNILSVSEQVGTWEGRFSSPIPPLNIYVKSRSNLERSKFERDFMSPESRAKNEENKENSSNFPNRAPAFHLWDNLPIPVQDVLLASQNTRPCPRHFVPLLQGRSNPRKGLSLRVDCRNHPCPVCGSRRRGQWLRHFMLIFELEPKLFAAIVALENVHGLRQYIRRKSTETGEHGNYLTIQHLPRDQADGEPSPKPSALLIASSAFPGCRCVLPREAAELTALALLSIDLNKQKPVNTSKAWALCEERLDSDYQRRGSAPRGMFAEVVQKLKSLHLDPAVAPGSWGARADWIFPGNWCEEQILWTYEGLSEITQLPPAEEEGTET